jgi:hypothetical protein
MPRFRCPECNTESEVTGTHGREVVALYCLRHTGGADSHTRPVYMVIVEPAGASTVPSCRSTRPIAAGAHSHLQHSRTERRAADEAEAQPAAVSV